MMTVSVLHKKVCEFAFVVILCAICFSSYADLYGIGSGFRDGSSNFYQILNYATNPTARDIGETGQAFYDMAINPLNGLAYGITFGSELYSIDTEKGTSEIIGSTGVFQLNALEFDFGGTLYAWGHWSSELYCLDLETAAATPILDIVYAYGGDLAFDTDGVLYASNSDELVRIDLTSGTATLVGAFGVFGIFGLDIDVDGSMYGSQGSVAFFGGGNTANLYRVDKNTGSAELIGPIAGAEQFGNFGLSFGKIEIVTPVRPGNAVTTKWGEIKKRRAP